MFFLRYWLSGRDRFFLFLALSFWIEAANRVDLALTRSWNEDTPAHYLIRLVFYGLIVYESPRFSRRLNTLRGLSHEQVEQVLARGA